MITTRNQNRYSKGFGFKIFRKYRKANLVKEFIDNNNVRAIFFDHWKSIENINVTTLNKTKSFCLIHSKEINHSVGSLINKRMLKAYRKLITLLPILDLLKI